MTFYAFANCPHCKAFLGGGRHGSRKPSAPLFFNCPKCGKPINCEKHCIEWELLSQDEQSQRTFANIASAVVIGAVWSFTVAILLNAFILQGDIESEWRGFVLMWLVLTIPIGAWHFHHHMKLDIEGSASRLKDPSYRKALREMGKTLPEKYDQAEEEHVDSSLGDSTIQSWREIEENLKRINENPVFNRIRNQTKSGDKE